MSVFGVILIRIFLHSNWISLYLFVSLRIQSECGKIRTRITQNTSTFHAVSLIKRKKKILRNTNVVALDVVNIFLSRNLIFLSWLLFNLFIPNIVRETNLHRYHMRNHKFSGFSLNLERITQPHIHPHFQSHRFFLVSFFLKYQKSKGI